MGCVKLTYQNFNTTLKVVYRADEQQKNVVQSCLNVDPIVKTWESSYATFANNPIWFIDPFGLDTTITTTIEVDGETLLHIDNLKEVLILPKSKIGYAMDKVIAATGRFLNPKYGNTLVSDKFLGIGSPRIGINEGDINVDFMLVFRSTVKLMTLPFMMGKQVYDIIKQIYNLHKAEAEVVNTVIDEIEDALEEKSQNENIENELILGNPSSEEVKDISETKNQNYHGTKIKGRYHYEQTQYIEGQDTFRGVKTIFVKDPPEQN